MWTAISERFCETVFFKQKVVFQVVFGVMNIHTSIIPGCCSLFGKMHDLNNFFFWNSIQVLHFLICVFTFGALKIPWVRIIKIHAHMNKEKYFESTKTPWQSEQRQKSHNLIRWKHTSKIGQIQPTFLNRWKVLVTHSSKDIHYSPNPISVL